MFSINKITFALLFCSVFCFALTQHDLERMQEALRNPITLESVEKILQDSEVSYESIVSQYSNRPDYQGICTFVLKTLPINVKVEFDHTTNPVFGEKKIIRKIRYEKSLDNPAYRFINGRFQYENVSLDKNEERKTRIEALIQKSNLLLDQIDDLNLTCESSTRCEKALQGRSIYQVSEMLGNRGVCNGKSEMKVCNYHVELDDSEVADFSIVYLNSGSGYGDDYTPYLFGFNDVKKIDSLANISSTFKTVKIGKQEWMDHNLLYGEGLTGKYGVDIVANKDFSNVTDLDYGHESVSMPSGEMNSWFVMMDLNLRDRNYHDFLEKPDIKENHRGVCPAGFHVPTINEWEELFSFVIKDKVKFSKYNLFGEYAEAKKTYESNCSYFGGCNPAGKKASDKMTKIHKELDSIYDKWRKGRKDGFNCGVGEKCHYNLDDMQNVILREMVRHLCTKNSWPLDENGEDVCFDSYGFSLSSNSKTGDKMNYWTADADVSKCRDIFEEGHHLCTYEITGYGFSIQNQWREFNIPRFESLLGNANLRCLKNGGKK